MGINIESSNKHWIKNTKYKPINFAETCPRYTLFLKAWLNKLKFAIHKLNRFAFTISFAIMLNNRFIAYLMFWLWPLFPYCLLREKCRNAESFSDPYFPVFGLNTIFTKKISYSVRLLENMDQKKLRIRTLFKQWWY